MLFFTPSRKDRVILLLLKNQILPLSVLFAYSFYNLMHKAKK